MKKICIIALLFIAASMLACDPVRIRDKHRLSRKIEKKQPQVEIILGQSKRNLKAVDGKVVALDKNLKEKATEQKDEIKEMISGFVKDEVIVEVVSGKPQDEEIEKAVTKSLQGEEDPRVQTLMARLGLHDEDKKLYGEWKDGCFEGWFAHKDFMLKVRAVHDPYHKKGVYKKLDLHYYDDLDPVRDYYDVNLLTFYLHWQDFYSKYDYDAMVNFLHDKYKPQRVKQCDL